jgi:hypothetical protein
MLALGEGLECAGVDPRSISLEIGIHGAEPWSEEMHREIAKRFDIMARLHPRRISAQREPRRLPKSRRLICGSPRSR